MKRRIFIIILFLFIAITLTGCGTKKDELYGKWIAKPEDQLVFYTNAKDTVGGREDYILDIDGKGNFKLKLNKKETKKGSYTIQDKEIIFKDEKDSIISNCKIKNKKELDCSENSTYAIKYTKVKDKEE